jgi:hypothetical protein
LKWSCWTMNLGTTPAYTGKDLGELWKHNSGWQSQGQDLERGRGGRRVGVLQDWGFHNCLADNLHRLRCNAVSRHRRNDCSNNKLLWQYSGIHKPTSPFSSPEMVQILKHSKRLKK